MTKKSTNKPAAAAGENLAEVLVPTAFVTMAMLNKIGAEHDLSLTLIRVLGILWDRRPRMAELADYLGLEKQTMSGLIARAEKRGLVGRAASVADARATEVFLTAAGAQLVARLHEQGRAALAPMTQCLSIEEQQLLQELLQRMLDSRGA